MGVRHGISGAFFLIGCPSAPLEVPPEEPTPGWRSALYPEDWTPAHTHDDGGFLHDFSYAGYRGGAVPVPGEPRAPFADALDFGADPTGEADSTSAIQAAIDSLDTGGTVVLPPGTFRIDDVLRVERSEVAIAGDPDFVTYLRFTRLDGMSDRAHLTFAGDVQQGPDLPLAADGEARSFAVTLEDASSIAVGDDVAVGWVITDEFVDEHAMTGTWVTFNGQWKPFFRREVVAVEGDVVSLDVPLRYPAKVRDSASIRVETGYLTEVGLIGVSVATAGDPNAVLDLDRTHAVRFEDVADGYVRRLRSWAPDPDALGERHLASGGLKVQSSKRVTVTDSELGYAQHRGGGGNGYLFEISRSSEILVRDSIGVAGRHNFIQNWDFGTSGCVWLRTTSRDGLAAWEDLGDVGTVGLSEYHHSLAMANLVDDSIATDGWGAVNRHDWSSGAGHSATQSVFWNVRGDEGDGGGEGLLQSFQFRLGYVIGTEGIEVFTDIAEDGLFSPGEGTEPNDWTEGIGEAATLDPPSLYEDQLARRLGR